MSATENTGPLPVVEIAQRLAQPGLEDHRRQGLAAKAARPLLEFPVGIERRSGGRLEQLDRLQYGRRQTGVLAVDPPEPLAGG